MTATGTVSPDPTETHTIAVYNGRPDVALVPICVSPQSLTSTGDIAASANTASTVVSGPTPPALAGVVTITVTAKTGTVGAAGIFATTPASYGDWPANAYQLTGSSLSFSNGSTYSKALYLTNPASASSTYTAVFDFIAIGSPRLRLQ